MTTYVEKHGGKIVNYSSDPSNLIEGEVWYNSTSAV